MATRKQSQGPQQLDPPLELKIDREQAKSRLTARIEKGRDLDSRSTQTPQELKEVKDEFYKWDAFNALMLKQIFTNGSLASEYTFWGIATLGRKSFGEEMADLHKDIRDKCRRLDSIAERLELIPVETSAGGDHPITHRAELNSNKVFIVHGHDEVAKTSLEVFIRENGLEPVVLHRQADQGQTIIEKFERHSEVGYAFILLTPDELAYLAIDDAKHDSKRKKEFRARPNVLFEFGFFVGKLGRSRVCCLHTGGVSLPSDVNGMIYKAYSKSIEEVGYSILKDLKAAGYSLR